MVRTLAALVFIGGVGAAAVVIAQKKTVIRGDVMAADFLERLKEHGVNEVTCDDAPVDDKGAVFICRLASTNGSRVTLEITMDREGGLQQKQLGDATWDRPRERHQDPNADPWTQ